MVDCLLDRGWSIEAAAERFQVEANTVREWRDRFLAEGPGRSRGPFELAASLLNGTPQGCRRQVVQLRRKRRWGADFISHEVGIAAPTMQHIVRAEGLGRLDRGDRATADPVRPC